ncbi:MAG: DUF2752 domain-containing protein [Lachnospiraceae bacterium]|nr:DUF2752 domain-containing protein [Lachnospiraceae bacterium]
MSLKNQQEDEQDPADDKKVPVINIIKKDIRENLPAFIAIAGYILIFQLFFHTICPMQLMFGLPCPGCGLTRAAILLCKGDIYGAFKMHPFIFALIALALYWGIYRYILQKKPKLILHFSIAVFAGMVIFYIFRMIMYYPDTQPMDPRAYGLIRILTDHF